MVLDKSALNKGLPSGTRWLLGEVLLYYDKKVIFILLYSLILYNTIVYIFHIL